MLMETQIHGVSSLQGTLRVPPDKAICHRAVLASALAHGVTRIHPWSDADDCQWTLEVVKGLGVACKEPFEAVVIEGSGIAGLKPPQAELLCGESGTTLRLAAGVLASQPFRSQLSASPSLARRPMQRIVTPLTLMGAQIEAQTQGEGTCTAPLVIQGRRPLRAIRFEPDVASAQVKSAILFAALGADGLTVVAEPYATRDHTERMLRQFGARVRVHDREVRLEPGELKSPGDVFIPGDVSSAAFFIVAGLIVPGSRVELVNVSLNPSRTRFLSVLERMGARFEIHLDNNDAEPYGRIIAQAQPLRTVQLLPDEVPGVIDELPILMVAASCAEGVSTFRGLAELRVKETDRVASMVNALHNLGAAVSEPEPDTVRIEGGKLRPGEIESAGDHRTAMSLAVAALTASGTSLIRDSECVRKSYPDFFKHLGQLCGPDAVTSD